jgi:hypothetical protein
LRKHWYYIRSWARSSPYAPLGMLRLGGEMKDPALVDRVAPFYALIASSIFFRNATALTPKERLKLRKESARGAVLSEIGGRLFTSSEVEKLEPEILEEAQREMAWWDAFGHNPHGESFRDWADRVEGAKE